MKNIYKIRFLIAVVVLGLAIAGICGIFYGVKVFDVQLLPVLQRVFVDFSVAALAVLLGIFVLTLIFGRLYCSLICPLGIIQEIAGIVFFSGKRKNKYIKNYPIKYFISAASLGILAGGSAIAIRYVDPYTYFGSAFTLSFMGLLAVAIILVLTL